MHSASVQVELSVTILEENIAEVNNKHLGLVKLGSCFCSLRTVDETTAERCFERPFAVIANELTRVCFSECKSGHFRVHTTYAQYTTQYCLHQEQFVKCDVSVTCSCHNLGQSAFVNLLPECCENIFHKREWYLNLVHFS